MFEVSQASHAENLIEEDLPVNDLETHRIGVGHPASWATRGTPPNQ